MPLLFLLGYVDDVCCLEALLLKRTSFNSMLLSDIHSRTQTVFPGTKITQRDVRSFRAQVGLALASADSVIVDLRSTKRVDSWALLAIWELEETFGPRLSFAVPDYLRGSIPPKNPQ